MREPGAKDVKKMASMSDPALPAMPGDGKTGIAQRGGGGACYRMICRCTGSVCVKS